MNIDLADLFESLVLPLELPSGRSLSAATIPGAPNHRLAKDLSGSPCLLLRESTTEVPVAPIRLQHLLVSYGVRCIVNDVNKRNEEGVFTIVKCSSSDPSLFPHFLRILSPIVASLGVSPSAASVRKAITGLVDLFRALSAPAKKSVQGLWAELLVIRYATNPRALVAAWHGLPAEHVDFLDGRKRIEVKSSSNRQRVHHFSLAQLTPPVNTRLFIASVFVEPVGGGLSLQTLSHEIRHILASDTALLTQFDAILYATLGDTWSDAMEECFDLELAIESLSFFDSIHIPKIEAPIPVAVSNIRFVSDISRVPALGLDTMRTEGGLFAAIAPTR